MVENTLQTEMKIERKPCVLVNEQESFCILIEEISLCLIFKYKAKMAKAKST